jgi:acyl-coenzyme A synthetase/AMP-(fatty) acid ligase
MHILDMVFHWARMDPHRPAIILPEMITTFAGLADGIESVSTRIDKLDLDKREPVAVAIATPALFVVAVFALLRSGYSAVLANRGLIPHLQPNGIRNVIYDVDGLVASGGRNIRFDSSWLPTGPLANRKHQRRLAGDGDGDVVVFTSGTTGLPKKFVQTRRGLEQRIAQRTTADTMRRAALVVPGLASAFGFNRTCEILHSGKTACFAPSIEGGLHLIGLFRIDTVVASAQQALALATAKESEPDAPVDSLHAIFIAGSKLGPEGVKRVRASLCRNVINEYASTEAGVAAVAPFEGIEAVPGAVGFATPWAEVEIVDEAGMPLPNGREGIVRYRTQQFLDNIEPGDGEAPHNRWFYPGDMGQLTEQGILCISGRTTDIINIGGTKFSANRIEEIVASMPGVRETAACGVEDASGLEQLWIAVVPSGPVDIEGIKRRVREDKDAGIAPEEVLLVQALPRGDLGKVQKAKLKEMMLGLKPKS